MPCRVTACGVRRTAYILFAGNKSTGQADGGPERSPAGVVPKDRLADVPLSSLLFSFSVAAAAAAAAVGMRVNLRQLDFFFLFSYFL